MKNEKSIAWIRIAIARREEKNEEYKNREARLEEDGKGWKKLEDVKETKTEGEKVVES